MGITIVDWSCRDHKILNNTSHAMNKAKFY